MCRRARFRTYARGRSSALGHAARRSCDKQQGRVNEVAGAFLGVASALSLAVESYVVHEGDAGVEERSQGARLDVESVNRRMCRSRNEVRSVKIAIFISRNSHDQRRPDEANHFCRRA
jgi:hypothetical protein